MKLNGYQIVSESIQNPVTLPSDLVTFMLTPQFNKYNNFKVKTEKDIAKQHLQCLDAIKEWLEWGHAPNEEHGTIDSKKTLKLIQEKNLYFVRHYMSGDYAGFSLVDQYIYDFNHDLNTFNVLHPDTQQDSEFRPIHYKQWMKQIQHDKHLDAWNN